MKRMNVIKYHLVDPYNCYRVGSICNNRTIFQPSLLTLWSDSLSDGQAPVLMNRVEFKGG